MSDDVPATPSVSTAAPMPKSKSAKVFWIALEIFAATSWAFVLCKLFVFDLDAYLVNHYLPSYAWVLNFRLLFFLSIVAAWLWLMGIGKGTLFLVLLLFYPAFFVLWRIPSLIFRQRSWALAFAAFNFTIEFFRSFRRNVTAAAVLLTFFALCVFSTDPSLLYCAMSGLLVTIAYLYCATLRSALAPAQVYSLYARILPPVRSYLTTTNKLDEAIRSLPPAQWNDTQRKVWSDRIQIPILANRFYLFLARKFRDYQRSPIPYLHNVGIVVALFLVTIFVFGGINFALFKLEPASYETNKTDFFSFVWYSFNVFVFNFIKEVAPESVVAKSLWMLEASFALVLIAIIVAMYLSIRSQRLSDQVDSIIDALEGESRELESFVQQEYQIASIEDALAELDRLKAGMVQLMLWLTRNIR